MSAAWKIDGDERAWGGMCDQPMRHEAGVPQQPIVMPYAIALVQRRAIRMLVGSA